jgi:hypothetical protein
MHQQVAGQDDGQGKKAGHGTGRLFAEEEGDADEERRKRQYDHERQHGAKHPGGAGL